MLGSGVTKTKNRSMLVLWSRRRSPRAARTRASQTGLKPFVLQNTDGGGLTIIEKLEHMIGKNARSSFVSCFYADDVGYAKADGDAQAKPRARRKCILRWECRSHRLPVKRGGFSKGSWTSVRRVGHHLYRVPGPCSRGRSLSLWGIFTSSGDNHLYPAKIAEPLRKNNLHKVQHLDRPKAHGSQSPSFCSQGSQIACMHCLIA